jgi:hypothetical protein
MGFLFARLTPTRTAAKHGHGGLNFFRIRKADHTSLALAGLLRSPWPLPRGHVELCRCRISEAWSAQARADFSAEKGRSTRPLSARASRLVCISTEGSQPGRSCVAGASLKVVPKDMLAQR